MPDSVRNCDTNSARRRATIESTERYWRALLSGVAEATVLELERARPEPSPVASRWRRRRRLDGATGAALERLAGSANVCVEACSVAAWALLLGRHAHRRDLVFGVVAYERHALPLRLEIVRSSRLDRWLEEVVAKRLDESRSYGDVSLEQIESWSPLPPQVPLIGQVLGFDREVPEGFALTLRVEPDSAAGWLLELEADARRFEPTDVGRLLAQLASLLGIMAHGSETELDALPVLTRAERHQVLVEWNDRDGPESDGCCAQDLFEEVAGRQPATVALIVDGREVSYAELDDRASRLARRLRALGVGPDSVVAVAIERSLEMMVAFLAVWKAGGAYLPLDPAYPKENQAFMLGDSGAVLVLTREGLRKRFKSGHPVVFLDSEPTGPTAGRRPSSDASQLAYVIYTSGSTGRPKGVMVPHRGLVDRLRSLVRIFDLAPGDRQLQFVSASFDVSIEEIFAPLASGAAVVLETEVQRLAPLEVLAVGRLREATKLNLPASYWHQMVDELEIQDQRVPECLRILGTGAETLSPSKLSGWLRRAPAGCNVFNIYGPTETTILASLQRLPKLHEWEDGGSRVPIGRPLGNTAIYLLDRELRPVPLGATGQMWIGGIGVSRGYLRRAAITADRFLPDPFAERAGMRFYRTGDLACHLPDGRIDFLGRVDRQVKVRGFRIELDEVEETVRRLPGVGEAAVVLRDDLEGDPRLVAYVVAAEGVEVDSAALRSVAAERLPEQMVPAHFLALDELPRTTTGKIDRRSLPRPEPVRSAAAYEAPRTTLERFVAGLWQEVLGLVRIGVNDDWNEIGGDSIKGAIFISRLEKRLTEYVYVVALFDAPTVADFASYLERHYPEAVSRVLGERRAGGEKEKRSRPIDAVDLGRFRGMIESLSPYEEREPAPNPRAVFVLSPPRSGSTLLRVMLAGHPRLFAPPELELLSFNTLAERRAEFTGRYAFWLEGTIRALMALDDANADAARREMEAFEAQGLSAKEFYRVLQDRAEGRVLVDKTPSYALDLEILARAESVFDRPLYVHLLRHPCGMIRSFEDARIDQLFFRRQHPFSPRQLAELVWTTSHHNILEFLGALSEERHHRVRYEDLVTDPEGELGKLCEFLGLEFDPAMLDPYRDKRSRMTDGIHPLAKMLGDVKFHQHRRIDPRVAERWRETYDHDFLGAPTWELAATFGYRRPREWRSAGEVRGARSRSPLVELQPGDGSTPLVCVHPVGGHVECYRDLARSLGPGRPVFGLRARGLTPDEEPRQRIDEMAEAYLEALRELGQPFALLGWSMGGKIAFEMARRLLEMGEKVPLLALVDARADLPRGGSGRRTEAELLLGSLEGDAVLPRERIAKLDPGRQLAVAVEHLQQAGKLPEDFDGVHRYLRVHLANREAARSYRPRPYSQPVVLYRPLEERIDLVGDETAGWRPWARGGLEVQKISGTHETIIFPPHVDRLADHLRQLLGS